MGSDSEKKAAVEKMLAARRAVLEQLSADQAAEGGEAEAASELPAEAPAERPAERLAEEKYDGAVSAPRGPALVTPDSPAGAHVPTRKNLWGDEG